MRVLVIVGGWPKPGHFVHTFTKRQVESLQALGIECDLWNLEELASGWRKYLAGIGRVSTRIRQQPYDLIHAHFGYCGWVARSQFRQPVVVSFMGDDLLGTPDAMGRSKKHSRLIVQLNRWMARTVDAVIVKSPQMARVVAPIKADVVSNGVDLDLFQPIDARQARAQLGWSQDKRYVLFPGCADVPVKGFPQAQAAVRHTIEQVTEPVEMIKLCKVPPDKVPLYMNACDVLLMTSWHEGSPNVVKEAMACNLPVVSVAVGDVPELLSGMEEGIICPRDTKVLSAALTKVLSAPRRTNGRELLKRKGLDLESVARKVLDIYEDVLTRKGKKKSDS